MKSVLPLVLAVLFIGGFASLTHAQADRNVMVEIFTSTTCPPCAPAAAQFGGFLNSYEFADRVSVIKYPVSWPGAGCIFYHQNPIPVNNRRSYYGINAAPSGVVDGSIVAGGATGWINRIQNRMSVSAPYEIDMFAMRSDDGMIKIYASVTRVGSENHPESGSIQMRIGIVERNISYNAPNGTTNQDFVHRNMAPSPFGLPVTLAVGETTVLETETEWNDDWVEENIKVTAFIQQVADPLAVLQSAMVPLQSDYSVDTPVLVSPANGAADVPADNLVFSWNEAAGAAMYDFELSTSADFSTSEFLEEGVGNTSYTIAELQEGTTYYWRVRSTFGSDFVSEWSDVFEFTTMMSSSIGRDSELPLSYELYQNYPNPFNPGTQISFHLPHSDAAAIRVYTVDGRYISTLADGVFSAGTHQVYFDASALSSGIYLYRLETRAEVITRKMTLIK
ncbi:MAG: T9SS type A sorting domain-containing protein [Balneolales bacterium]|nr:T9SS type A sorting domain-containing protein [Balneolales bacterium]